MSEWNDILFSSILSMIADKTIKLEPTRVHRIAILGVPNGHFKVSPRDCHFGGVKWPFQNESTGLPFWGCQMAISKRAFPNNRSFHRHLDIHFI